MFSWAKQLEFLYIVCTKKFISIKVRKMSIWLYTQYFFWLKQAQTQIPEFEKFSVISTLWINLFDLGIESVFDLFILNVKLPLDFFMMKILGWYVYYFCQILN